jgi:hypothetical protein
LLEGVFITGKTSTCDARWVTLGLDSTGLLSLASSQAVAGMAASQSGQNPMAGLNQAISGLNAAGNSSSIGNCQAR